MIELIHSERFRHGLVESVSTYSWDVLPDYPAPNLMVVFVGTADGERSASVGHYYAGRGNKFWKRV